MARPTYKEFVRHTGQPPKRSPMDCITSDAEAVFFRNRQMNRDGRPGAPDPVRPDSLAKTVHIYHHRAPRDE